jgi:hypothetical protein
MFLPWQLQKYTHRRKFGQSVLLVTIIPILTACSARRIQVQRFQIVLHFADQITQIANLTIETGFLFVVFQHHLQKCANKQNEVSKRKLKILK